MSVILIYQNNKKCPSIKSLPNVCYTYFTELKNFQNKGRKICISLYELNVLWRQLSYGGYRPRYTVAGRVCLLRWFLISAEV